MGIVLKVIAFATQIMEENGVRHTKEWRVEAYPPDMVVPRGMVVPPPARHLVTVARPPVLPRDMEALRPAPEAHLLVLPLVAPQVLPRVVVRVMDL